MAPNARPERTPEELKALADEFRVKAENLLAMAAKLTSEGVFFSFSRCLKDSKTETRCMIALVGGQFTRTDADLMHSLVESIDTIGDADVNHQIDLSQ